MLTAACWAAENIRSWQGLAIQMEGIGLWSEVFVGGLHPSLVRRDQVVEVSPMRLVQLILIRCIEVRGWNPICPHRHLPTFNRRGCNHWEVLCFPHPDKRVLSFSQSSISWCHRCSKRKSLHSKGLAATRPTRPPAFITRSLHQRM